MKVKILTDQGIDHFFDLYNELNNNDIDEISLNNFKKDIHINDIDLDIEIDRNKGFSNRFEMGKYLNNIFNNHIEKVREYRAGIWSWIAVLWFDKICPFINGSRKIYAPEKYICYNNYKKYYRHLISSSFEMYHIHKKYSRLLIKKKLYTLGEAIEQLASRQEIISSTNLIKAADMLYWDKENDTMKSGATSKKPGGLRRFIDVIRQLIRTYDLYSCEAEKIIELLPEEFDKWED